MESDEKEAMLGESEAYMRIEPPPGWHDFLWKEYYNPLVHKPTRDELVKQGIALIGTGLRGNWESSFDGTKNKRQYSVSMWSS